MKNNDIKIFVLGDSRTGTSSIGSYLSALGFSSKHYYVKEAKQISPDHDNREENWRNLEHYIDNSPYQAFSDYPTRLYYKKLSQRYPDAFFILSVRESTSRWLQSMMKYFPKFGIKLKKEKIVKNYEQINESIEQHFGNNTYKFLKINIDGDNQLNSTILKSFLGVTSSIDIGWENKSEDVDIEDISKRKILFQSNSTDWLLYVENVTSPYKTLLSEKGWIYLINDSNDFFRWCYGYYKWSSADTDKVIAILNNRSDVIEKLGSKYFKFIIPEKNIIYNEYLPNIFSNREISTDRPAIVLSKNVQNVYYLEKYLKSLKGFGQLYFRGDSHTNWLGSYHIYRHIHNELGKHNYSLGKPIPLDELSVSIANYQGDLYSQLSNQQLEDVHGVWGPFNLKQSLEYDIKFSLKNKNFKFVDIPEYYKKYSDERELIITENADANEISAVVFRDSTCDFIIDYLSTHFKRIVYIWHKGEVYKEVIEKEKPDIVLHFMAERFLRTYPDRCAFC